MPTPCEKHMILKWAFAYNVHFLPQVNSLLLDPVQ